MEVISLFLGVALIIFFGYLAEHFYGRFGVPDVLLLIVIGLAIGPLGLNLVQVSTLNAIAAPFTTFVLLFLLFDGAFNIDLSSFAKGVSEGTAVTIYHFVLSSLVTSTIMLIFGYDFFMSLLVGVALGGISSAFVIPILRSITGHGSVTSALTLESAFTDVLAIVLGLAVIDIISLKTFSVQAVFANIIQLFAIAGLVGVLAGWLWIFIHSRILKGEKFYMLTIAYVLLLYVVTEWIGGNGAIAALTFGLVLKNSRVLSDLLTEIRTQRRPKEPGIRMLGKDEEFFYEQLAFLLKTLFFVYIGVLIPLNNLWALVIGTTIAIGAVLSRQALRLILGGVPSPDRSFFLAVYGRGLAPAALAEIAVNKGAIPAGIASETIGIIYIAIFATILFSSIQIYMLKRTVLRTEAVKATTSK